MSKLRGIDYKYTYEFDKNKKPILGMPLDYDSDYGYEHLKAIEYAIKNDVYYNRWQNNE